jgi:hypothetical protein
MNGCREVTRLLRVIFCNRGYCGKCKAMTLYNGALRCGDCWGEQPTYLGLTYKAYT